jgi:hypothetical protein
MLNEEDVAARWVFVDLSRCRMSLSHQMAANATEAALYAIFGKRTRASPTRPILPIPIATRRVLVIHLPGSVVLPSTTAPARSAARAR